MDPHEEKELEESLEFMRKQFQTLTDDIKIPDSLRADLLKKQLELMEAEQEEREERGQRKAVRKSRGRVSAFPLRAMVGFAACVVVVSVSFLSYQLGQASGGSKALEAAPSAAPASVSSEEEAVPMEMEAAPMEAGLPEEDAMGAPTPYDVDGGGDTGTASTEEASQAAVPEPLMADAAPMPRSAGSVTDLPESAPAKTRGVGGLTLEDAKAGEYGRYLPDTLPQGLSFSVAVQGTDSLSISYLNEDYSRQIQMTFRPLTSDVQANVVNPSNPETYDLRLYTLPYTDSVPAELASTLNDPVFRWEDLNTALVEARVFDPDGGFARARGNFSVLFPTGIVAELNITGVSALEVYTMLTDMYQ